MGKKEKVVEKRMQTSEHDSADRQDERVRKKLGKP